MSGRYTGFVVTHQGKFGFIRPDDGSEDMFVMPAQCAPFGGQLPPVTARVVYSVVADAKTGKPRADDVVPEQMELPAQVQQQSFARQKAHLQAPQLLSDSTLSSLAPEESAFLAQLQASLSTSGVEEGAPLTGTMLTHNGRFGFIKQDSGEEDMFVMPVQCEAFGKDFPPEGFRVAYGVVVDGKTGRPRAEGVMPESQYMQMHQQTGATAPIHAAPRGKGLNLPRVAPAQAWAPQVWAQGGSPVAVQQGHWDAQPAGATGAVQTGTVVENKGKFGFVRPDGGEADIFLMPIQCEAFGCQLPPSGTRVLYTVGMDPQKGRPVAENVQPEQQWPLGVAGTMLKVNGNFGFIQQDSGEGDMFVMPAQCHPGAFGGMLPPIGARLTYEVVTDPKTCRPRAENVQPEVGGKGKGQGKFKGHAWAPSMAFGRVSPY